MVLAGIMPQAGRVGDQSGGDGTNSVERCGKLCARTLVTTSPDGWGLDRDERTKGATPLADFKVEP